MIARRDGDPNGERPARISLDLGSREARHEVTVLGHHGKTFTVNLPVSRDVADVLEPGDIVVAP